MKITVIGGSGYVGFITGLGFAQLGHDVTNVDIDEEKVEMMNEGQSPIYEENVDLSEVLASALEEDRIRFTTDLAQGVRPADVIFIAVGTPQSEDGEADLSQVIEVAEELVDYIEDYKVIAMKSTVPVGTIDLVCDILGREKEEGKDFDVVSNPEFLREGKGLYDFFHPSRIVVGSSSAKALEEMRKLYSPFVEEGDDPKSQIPNPKSQIPNPKSQILDPKKGVPLVETDIKSAQTIKYASNTFLATRISFINEIAGLCEKIGADVEQVSEGMGYDPRIGHDYLSAGIGFGGPCLEKDLKALIKISENNDYEPGFLSAVLEKNEEQIKEVVSKVKKLAGYPLYKKIITVYGLAFKAGTNDVRTSLSLRIIDRLENLGAEIKAHDPRAIPEARELRPKLDCYEDPYKAARHGNALLVLTDWEEYEELDYGRVRDNMAAPNLIDGRNTLDPERMKEMGFVYRGMGRG